MLKILVPTDFSAASESAVNYAVELCKIIDAELDLLNVVHLKGALTDTMIKELENVLVEQADLRLQLMKEQIAVKAPDLKVQVYEVEGKPVHEYIEKVTERMKADLLIMGTGGGNGIRKFYGTNTSHVLENLPCPLIVVPEGAVFSGYNHIVYATDLTEEYEELPLIIDWARLFHAEITVVHVFPENYKTEMMPEEIADDLRKKYHYQSLFFHAGKGNNIAEEVNRYTSEHSVDLIAVFTKKRNIVERLFHSSVSKALSFESKVPMLVFRKPPAEGFIVL